MEATIVRTMHSASNLLGELGSDFLPFRGEIEVLLTQLKTSHENQAALAEKSKTLSVELDAVRLSSQEVRQETDDLTNTLRAVQDDCTRLQEEAHKLRLSNATAESTLRETKSRIAGMEALKALGAGWTTDQLSQQAVLEKQRAAAAAELEQKQAMLSQLRSEVALLTTHAETAQAKKAEMEAAISRLKDRVTDLRMQALTAQRAKDAKERELKEAQEKLAMYRHALSSKVERVEETGAELSSEQETLRREKAQLDFHIKEFERVRTRTARAAEDLETQVRNNQALATELNTLCESTSVSRASIARVKKETEKLRKLQELTLGKVNEAEARRQAAEARVQELRRRAEELEAEVVACHRQNETKRGALDDTRREADVLTRTLSVAGDKVRGAEEAVEAQRTVMRNIQSDVTGYMSSLRALRDSIMELEEQKAKYTLECDEAQQAHFTAVEGVKLQELQMAALQKKIEEGQTKLKQQQSLYDAVRADRNVYSKNLMEASSEIADMKRTYRSLTHTIETVKSDIEVKDVSLVKEHYDHHRVEKEKETLRNEVTRIQKQVQSCEQILSSQENELNKLNAIIAEADAEKARQLKEYEAVVTERNLLQGQLVRRDGELAALYEKLRVQKSSLANGAASFARLSAEREELASRIAALKGELLVAQTQTSDVGSLEAEAKRLEADVRTEKTKIRKLMDELERPINIHRWRALMDREPERWALIQRIHALQKRALDVRDEIRVREADIVAREKEYESLKTALARQPGPEVADAIERYKETIKSKTKQLRSLEVELGSYRERVDEYKREMARIVEAMSTLTNDYVTRTRAARRRAAGVGTPHAGAGSEAMSEAALLDVTAEMAAAGLSTSVHTPGAVPSAAADALKSEADRMLALYADVLS